MEKSNPLATRDLRINRYIRKNLCLYLCVRNGRVIWEQNAAVFVLNIISRERKVVMTEALIKKKKASAPVMHWRWLPAVLAKPRKTIHSILAEDKAVWLAPLLILSALSILAVLFAAPIQRQIIQSGSNIPENFQYWTNDEQNAFLQAQASQTSPLFLYVFPILQRVSGYWLIWLLTSSLLHLAITLRGSRSSRVGASNLAAWSMTPFILRVLVEIFIILFTRRLVENPGLSALLPSDAVGFNAYLRSVLAAIDLYYVWHVILLLVGVRPLSGLSKGKALSSALAAVFIMLLLLGVPGFIGTLLSGISTTSSFYFF